MKKHVVAASILALLTGHSALAQSSSAPVVLELFTSQGCSSCPPAEELLVELSRDSSLIPLTVHVDYWDYLGWKDPYSSAENTQRQRMYSSLQARNNVFTPQMMVDGTFSAIGSNARAVKAAISEARARPHHAIRLTPGVDGKMLNVALDKTTLDGRDPLSVLAFRFVRATSTPVKAGENRGETLQTVNSVTSIARLGSWNGDAASYAVAAPATASQGIAVVLQNEKTGQIFASAIR